MPSILIVDDVSTMHEMIGGLLNPLGYKSRGVSSGEQALEAYQEGSYDVVLADYSMEPMDGITLIEKLKKLDPDSVPIIMTGYFTDQMVADATKAGAVGVLEKPFPMKTLDALVKKTLEARSDEE